MNTNNYIPYQIFHQNRCGKMSRLVVVETRFGEPARLSQISGIVSRKVAKAQKRAIKIRSHTKPQRHKEIFDFSKGDFSCIFGQRVSSCHQSNFYFFLGGLASSRETDKNRRSAVAWIKNTANQSSSVICRITHAALIPT